MAEEFEITQIKVDGFNYPVAKVREDLVAQDLGIPVGLGHLLREEEENPFAYRWTGDDIFEIHYKGEWQEAESIDFEF